MFIIYYFFNSATSSAGGDDSQRRSGDVAAWKHGDPSGGSRPTHLQPLDLLSASGFISLQPSDLPSAARFTLSHPIYLQPPGIGKICVGTGKCKYRKGRGRGVGP